MKIWTDNGRWLLVLLVLGLLVAVTACIGRDRCDNDPAPGVDWNTCDKSKAELPGQNLSGANLEGIVLTEANLVRTVFSEARLKELT